MFKQIIPFKMLVRQAAFVPAYKPPVEKDFETIKYFVRRNKKILILTGAGISTESGSYVENESCNKILYTKILIIKILMKIFSNLFDSILRFSYSVISLRTKRAFFLT